MIELMRRQVELVRNLTSYELDHRPRGSTLSISRVINLSIVEVVGDMPDGVSPAG